MKPVGCKWIFKTKRDTKCNIERYKACLVEKGFTQREGINYNENFSLVSSKDSFTMIMALVAHFDLELHQMDVKTTFLNGEIDETIYMEQLENFVIGDQESMVCKLKKSFYGLEKSTRLWYYKFHKIISSFSFVINRADDCIYHKFSGSKYIFLVLYVDDILLATNDLNLLCDTKKFLSNNFEMKDLGNASYVLGIEIYRDRPKNILGLAQKCFIEKLLQRYSMQNCKLLYTSIAKGDKLSLNQCPKNPLEIQEVKKFTYALVVGSPMYVQVCSRPDIAYIVGLFDRYMCNPSIAHWKAAKKVLRYLQRTKNYILM